MAVELVHRHRHRQPHGPIARRAGLTPHRLRRAVYDLPEVQAEMEQARQRGDERRAAAKRERGWVWSWERPG
ncbi:hypothetical protein ACFYNO_33230 [Kitasatospora sp. NPDC006697]|uniref:hypothetical protein n=1 Tax=Kitasatospora sp. NPDC006697 TaxID=3364020 RepID=UPI0036BF74A8